MRSREDITDIVLHCSDSDLVYHDDISIIRDWHIQERRWKDVGYHWFITKTGDIQQGRKELIQGAGVRGFNKNSIHICLSGKEEFEDIEFLMLKGMLERICDYYPIKKVWYHRDLDNKKTCPNYTIDWLQSFNETIQTKKINC